MTKHKKQISNVDMYDKCQVLFCLFVRSVIRLPPIPMTVDCYSVGGLDWNRVVVCEMHLCVGPDDRCCDTKLHHTNHALHVTTSSYTLLAIQNSQFCSCLILRIVDSIITTCKARYPCNSINQYQ